MLAVAHGPRERRGGGGSARLPGGGVRTDPVVTTKFDPATPYEWGVQVAWELDNATLLTYDGDGHTACTSGPGCIDKAVEEYFLSGTMPAEGTGCSAEGRSEGTGA